MERLGEAVLSRLGRGDASDDLLREAEERARLARLTRELAEVSQRIPFWQRLLFFVDYPDEQREQALGKEIAACEAGLVELRGRIEGALEQVGKEFPPFALALRLERLAEATRQELTSRALLQPAARERLQAAIAAAAASIRDAWTPGLDEEALLRTLADERRCRALAEAGEPMPEPHARMGWLPLTGRRLDELLAGAVARGEYFEARRAAERLEEERVALAGEHASAADSVSPLDRLNVFTTSPEEAHRDGLAGQLAQLEERLRHARGRERAALHSAWAAYPPLAVHQRLVELEGLLAAVEPGLERTLTPAGKAVDEQVVVPRALLVAALRACEGVFRRAFPGVPFPREAASKLSLRPLPAPPDPPDSFLAPALLGLREGEAPAHRAEALAHAGLIAHLLRARAQSAGRVSLIDRLVFWSDTPDEARERELSRLVAWHRKQAGASWSRLLEEAEEAAGRVVPLRLRDLALDLSAAVDEIHTDGGNSSGPRSCAVYGQAEALAIVRQLQEELSGAYGLAGDRTTVMQAVLRCPPPEGPAPKAGPFNPISWEELVRLLARRLQGSSFHADYQAMHARLRDKQKAEFERASAADQISWWDRINFLSTTPAEQQEREMSAAVEALGQETRDRMLALDRQLDRALSAYPPARPFYALGGVADAISSVRAVCKRKTVSSGSGKNRRTRTVYYCDLQGKSAARSAVEGWCALLVATFGRLPGPHALLVIAEEAREDA